LKDERNHAAETLTLTWAEIDADYEGYGRKEGRSEFKTPCIATSTLKREIGRETKHDAEGSLKGNKLDSVQEHHLIFDTDPHLP
jgi:hypothetical protein